MGPFDNIQDFDTLFVGGEVKRITQENRELSRITEDFKKNPEKVPSNHG